MKGRVDFRRGVFDDQIEKHGYDLEHYHAIQCPCLKVETGQPDPLCPYCTHGWQYYGAEDVQGIMTGITTETQFTDTGALLLGTVRLTVKANVEIGYHDRIIHRNSLINFSELVFRSGEEHDKTRFDIQKINRVIGQDGTVYLKDESYILENGKIKWIGQQPEGEAQYAIAYQMHPTWLVLSHMNIIRDTHIKFKNPLPEHNRLPVQVMCKLEYLWGE